MERCIVCGQIIPEGRQICINCEREVLKWQKEADH